jgi:hypothetical protein
LGIFFLFVVSVVASGKSVILFRRWRRLRPVTDGGDGFTCTRETKEEGKRCIKIGAAEKGEKRHASDL